MDLSQDEIDSPRWLPVEYSLGEYALISRLVSTNPNIQHFRATHFSYPNITLIVITHQLTQSQIGMIEKGQQSAVFDQISQKTDFIIEVILFRPSKCEDPLHQHSQQDGGHLALIIDPTKTIISGKKTYIDIGNCYMMQQQALVNTGQQLSQQKNKSEFNNLNCFVSTSFLADIQQNGPQDKPAVSFEDSNKFPHNCVGRIKSQFELKKQQLSQTTVGVGTLVTQNLVLTCAHIIRPKNSFMKTKQIWFYLGSQTRKVKDWRYPKELHSQENDYALLLLEQDIVLPLYVGIIKDYTSQNVLGMLKLNIATKKMTVKYTFQEKKRCFGNTKNLTYQLLTKAGDSGSPLVVRITQATLYYVVAIHRSIKAGSHIGSSVKITDVVMTRLIDFEKEMTGKHYSYISRNTFQYEKIIQALKQPIDKYQRQCAHLYTEEKRKQDKKAVQMKKNQSFTTADGQQITFKKLQKQANKLEKEWHTFYNSYVNYDPNNESSFNMKQRDSLLAKLKHFRQQHTNIKNSNVSEMVSKIQKYIAWLSSGKWANGQDWATYVQEMQNRVNQLQQKCNLMGYPWDTSLLSQKLQFNKQYYPCQAMFAAKFGLMSTSLNYLSWMHRRRGTIDRKTEHMRVVLAIDELSMRDQLQLQKTSIKQQFPDTIKSPFTDYRLNGYYQMDNNDKAYEFQVEVLLPDQQSLYEFTWQHIKWVAEGFVFVYLTRNVNDITKRYSLTFKFISPFYSTIRDSIKVTTVKAVGDWIRFLLVMIRFVCRLHQQQLELCAPIEFCCFNPTKKGCLYFFGHWRALVYKIEKMSGQDRWKVKDYYPVQQILYNCSNKAAFKAIDVWSWACPSDVSQLLFLSQKLLIAAMTAWPCFRFNSEQTHQFMNKVCDLSIIKDIRFTVHK